MLTSNGKQRITDYVDLEFSVADLLKFAGFSPDAGEDARCDLSFSYVTGTHAVDRKEPVLKVKMARSRDGGK